MCIFIRCSVGFESDPVQSALQILGGRSRRERSRGGLLVWNGIWRWPREQDSLVALFFCQFIHSFSPRAYHILTGLRFSEDIKIRMRDAI